MTGFDNYIPSKWLDGILSVRVSTPLRLTTKPAFRRGSWVKSGILTAMVLAGGVVAATSPVLSLSPTGVINKVMDDTPTPQSPYAPTGYFNKLTAAIKAAPRFAIQSIELDPPVLV